ncbi:hypothetical protein [Paracoccus sp. SY]|uniref:hypothetical protein n=1 Tax=Paracoccus sp. SY TaxID=1330255 RepID=UPI000CD01A04|nr:hypothetical protein [Paracoccus sp. SY]
MLVLTQSALDPYATVPEWDGPRIIVRPAARLGDIRMPEGMIVAEYLQPPASVTQILCDLTRWLRPRLAENTAPLLFLDRPTDMSEIRSLAARGRSYPGDVATVWDGDRLVMLTLGEAIAESPLLPEFFDILRERGVPDDATMTRLLGETFDWT